MQQPELGKQLSALRKEKNLTQEELVEKSNVSVRTIQRIEAGEVLPRMSTVKILLAALGESYESFTSKTSEKMGTEKNTVAGANPNTVLTAAVAGSIFLLSEIILGAMEFSWFTSGRDWSFSMNAMYIALTILMVVSYAIFASGFIVLSKIFQNTLLRIIAILLIFATFCLGFLDVASLSVENLETLLIPYSAFSVIFGALGIAFGIALLRLQDSMGQLSRIAGILEIIVGCLLITVVLFFIGYVVLIPAVVIEILVLYRGYEYLSGTRGT